MTAARLEWSYNPWRDRPRQAALAVVAALACCALIASLRLPALVTGLLCIVCVATLAAAFVPVSCRLDDDGVQRRSGWFAERRPWSALKRAVRHADGVLLSPYPRRHWLDAYRAVFLPLPSSGATPAAEDLERMLSRHGL